MRRPSRYRFVAGDPLRGLAALAVAVYHAGTVSLLLSGHSSDLAARGWTGPFGFIGAPIGAGPFGVQIFFVLSGFLISRPFVAAFGDGHSMPRVGAYLRNRALRLLPGLWVAFGVVIFVAGTRGKTIADIPRLFAFSEDWSTSSLGVVFGQVWSLQVEARFYLVVPVIAGLLALFYRLSRRRGSPRNRLIFVGALALIVAGICLVLVPRGNTAAFYAPLAQAHMLLLGVALAAAELAFSWQWLASRAGRLLTLGAFVSAVTALIWLEFPSGTLPALLPFDYRLSVASIAAFAVLTLVAAPVLLQRAGARCWRMLDNPPLRWLGARSYGLYLYQLLILMEFAPLGPGTAYYRQTFVFLILVGIPVVIAAAALSWRLIEKPALRLKATTGRRTRPTVGASLTVTDTG